MLLTVGELAQVAGPSLRPHIGDLLPLIIDAVQDPAASQKRNVAIVTLGQVCRTLKLLRQAWGSRRLSLVTSCMPIRRCTTALTMIGSTRSPHHAGALLVLYHGTLFVDCDAICKHVSVVLDKVKEICS